jgi:cell division septation protein DedD
MNVSHHLNYLFLLYLFLLLGCGSSQSGLASPKSGPSSIREEFDPYTLNDDTFLLQTQSLNRSGPKEVTQPYVPTPEPTAPSKLRSGYRVQIAAVLDRSRAETLQKSIQRQLQTLTYVYYDDDTHLYKIQAGNKHTPAEAQQLRDDIRAGGFLEAYMVRTQIEVTETLTKAKIPVKTRGFRLQVFSASTRQAAEDARNQAKQKLSRDDIYIEFEPPYFKVRVGNCSTRKEAEKILEFAQKQGYETPFVVESHIQPSPR